MANILGEIGRGTFGKVFRGYGKNITSHNGEDFGECAVKTVPETANNAERLHFLIEASVMKQFNTAFIVKLYGVVSDGQPVLVVMELMDKGNLRDFLRSHRPGAEENKENRGIPCMEQYFTWAAQIADGMAYLESMKFCHRDLAARNCMVHADETVKIGDFGMARDIYYHEYYKPAGKRLMPVRWMAPESLKDGKFTMKSDVWSFGIVMYEMLTLGQQPYAGLGNDKVFNYICVKRRLLSRPTGCPDFWFKLMRVCWKYDPRNALLSII
uniref:Protein kinase domain-containing protein n=1 Tax=Ditylenchus dipsaci TaxID=166011 RepID=A0A915EBN3_9BILA